MHSNPTNSCIDWSPLLWNQFFSSYLDIPILAATTTTDPTVHPSTFDTFRTYFHGPSSTSTTPSTSSSSQKSILFILIHGAGHTSLAWALVAKLLVEQIPMSQVFAMDLRGHGGKKKFEKVNAVYIFI
ncbi:hypothetical protein HMI54_009904 [Coelomomyces lativittatus]|nr:hypothetical protein HMI54_009904 [Coelomomyces lativittatus]KAJ1503730.1 hypothetical protein HMI56_001978 [Coelomomyces lativittatus]